MGLRLSRRFRIAAIYGFDATEVDETVSSTDASGVDFDKIANELSVGEETLGDVRSHQLFVLGQSDWPNASRWTPYVGVGFGVAKVRMDFSWLWARSSDPRDISTGIGQPNEIEIRGNLAGTLSSGRKVLRDVMAGWVLIGGIDRRISDVTTVGLYIQWKRFDTFESDAYQGGVLRSHVPNLRLDGSEPVSTRSRTNDTGRISLMLTIHRSMR